MNIYEVTVRFGNSTYVYLVWAESESDADSRITDYFHGQRLAGFDASIRLLQMPDRKVGYMGKL